VCDRLSRQLRAGGVRAAHRRVHQRVRDRRGDGGTDRHARVARLGRAAPRLPAGWALTRFSRQYVVLVSGAMLTVGALGVVAGAGRPDADGRRVRDRLGVRRLLRRRQPVHRGAVPDSGRARDGCPRNGEPARRSRRRAGRHGRALVRLAARLLRARARLGRLHRRLRRLGPPDGPPGRRRGRHRFPRRRALGVEADSGGRRVDGTHELRLARTLQLLRAVHGR